MSEFPTRKQVEKIKEPYPIGTIIKLVSMKDPYRPVPSGTLGEVADIDDIGSLIMKWQNGQGLNLLPNEDKFEVVLKPYELLTPKNAVSNSNDFKNKIVIIKSELLEEMHRTPLNQLWLVTNSAELQSDSDIELQHVNDETLLCTANRGDILGIANDAVIQMYVGEQEQNQILSQEELGINKQRHDMSY